MAVTPLASFQSPLHPPEGEFPTTRPKRQGPRQPLRVCHVPCSGTQMQRRASGLSCRLQAGHRPRRPRASRPVHYEQASRQPSSPSRHLHFSRVRRCSRRGRAAASLPAGFVHRSRFVIPPPTLAAAVVRRCRAALCSAPPLRPPGIRSRQPRRGSLYASGPRLTTASRRQAQPSG